MSHAAYTGMMPAGALMQQYLGLVVGRGMNISSLLVSSALALGLIGISSTAVAAQRPSASAGRPGDADLKAFPPARPGQVRHVIRLPALKNEDTAKVELIVGKTMRVDCNRQMFGGQIRERTAEGWGYNYYVLDNLGAAASTMMGCADRTRRPAFVRSSHEQLVRYNSRLPLVIYAPSDVEVRYRIWRADAQEQRVDAPRPR